MRQSRRRSDAERGRHERERMVIGGDHSGSEERDEQDASWRDRERGGERETPGMARPTYRGRTWQTARKAVQAYILAAHPRIWCTTLDRFTGFSASILGVRFAFSSMCGVRISPSKRIHVQCVQRILTLAGDIAYCTRYRTHHA